MVADLPAVVMVMPDEPKTKPARVHSDLLSMLKLIEAMHSDQGKSFSAVEYIDKLIRGPITSEHKKALAYFQRK